MKKYGMITWENGYISFEKLSKGLEFLIGSVIFSGKEKRKKIVFYLERRRSRDRIGQYYARVYISPTY